MGVWTNYIYVFDMITPRCQFELPQVVLAIAADICYDQDKFGVRKITRCLSV